MSANIDYKTFNRDKGRNMSISPNSTTPRDQHGRTEKDSGRPGTPRKENHFSFGKIPNKKG